MNRREFFSLTAGGTVFGLATINSFTKLVMAATTRPEIKAIIFDAFPVFDPRPIFGMTKTLFPEQGALLGKLWFTKIFSYTWLRTTGEHYKDFYAVIEDALTFSIQSLKLDLTPNQQKQLMQVWLELKIWPDVKPVLQQLQERNIRLGFLSNMTEEMLCINAKNSGVEDMFEFYLSTDRVKAFKPDPRAYQLGIDSFDLPKKNIAFCAFAAWDAAGASWFGYPTVWINRLGQPEENLDIKATISGKSIKTLLNFSLVP